MKLSRALRLLLVLAVLAVIGSSRVLVARTEGIALASLGGRTCGHQPRGTNPESAEVSSAPDSYLIPELAIA